MVKTKEEVLSALKQKIGDDISDETISLLEDVTDTLNEYEAKSKDTTDWEKKFKENDDAWRAKYRERFFSKPPEKEEEVFEEEKPKVLSYEALFG